MTVIENKLSVFSIYLLNDLPNEDLMKRFDKKYVFHSSLLPEILESIHENYLVLCVNHSKIHEYENVYFDTTDFKMYLNHHNKKLNRYKVRLRKYNDTNVYFLEIKFKNNKSRTLKNRILADESIDLNNQSVDDFIKEYTPYENDYLEKSIHTKFNRISLANKSFTERVTIDSNLRLYFKSKSKQLDELVICEIKKTNKKEQSFLEEILFRKRIHPMSVSKYCLGNYFLNEHVKHNLYKEKVILLHKILNKNG